MSIWDKLRFKALSPSQVRFPGKSFVFFGQPRATQRDMERDVGDGTGANVFLTPVRWMQRSFNEAAISVERGGEVVEDHPLVQLVNKPNPFYSGQHLFAGTLLSLAIDGNAYWLCVRNGNGRIIELWYAPHHFIKPKFPDDGSEFLTSYEYKVGGKTQNLDIEDVIHFRDGLDPQNLRLGLSGMKSLMREIWTDQEASVMVAALMRNGGIPGVVVSPDSDEPIDSDDAEAVKEYIDVNFTRENRGKPLVMKGKTKVEQFGFSPQQMDLSKVRNISEERVCAALGVRAVIVGFGTGLQQTKVGATLKEERKLSWQNGIIPIQRIVAGELENHLLPLMERNTRNTHVTFDNSEVSALQEDETERIKRVTSLVDGGLWTVAEGREETGKEVTPADNVYLRDMSKIEVPRGRAAGQRQIEQRARREVFKRKQVKQDDPGFSTFERRISERPRVTSPPEQLIRLMDNLDRLALSLPGPMEEELLKFFVSLGAAAEQAALPVVKQAEENLNSEQILEGMAMQDHLPLFKEIHERAYIRVSKEVDKAVSSAIGVEVGIPDPQARAIIAAGGRRAGLIDLTAQSRRAIFDRLVEGRAEGLAGANLARFIRDKVESGPWSSPAIRSRVIARTETRHAQGVSVVEKAKAIDGVERMLMFDDRSDFHLENPSHVECHMIDGRIVTIQEAEILMQQEHPNGTRAATPAPESLIEEMGFE